jgi:hypothetical protein
MKPTVNHAATEVINRWENGDTSEMDTALAVLRDALRRDRDMSARRSRRIRGASPAERLAPVPAMPNRGNRT